MDRAEAEAILDGERETAIALLMRLDELIAANRRLEARVADLERQLNRTSRNSSLPPSLDPPSAPPRPRPPLSGRSPGGQPGHEGKNRRLLPLELVDEVVDHWPQRCQACARPFSANERLDARRRVCARRMRQEHRLSFAPRGTTLTVPAVARPRRGSGPRRDAVT